MNSASTLLQSVGQEKMRQRILSCSAPVPFSGCWIWERSLTTNGYGHLRFGKSKDVLAHRVSYAAWHGAIADDQCVLHSCDVRCCVNPAHLSVGSKKDNSMQMVQRGRNKSPASLRTQCPKGHDYSGLNSQGRRICHICNNEAAKRWNLKNRKFK